MNILKNCVVTSDKLTSPLKNGICRENKGFRCVLTDKDVVVRPVLFDVHIGSTPLQGTYQIQPKDGDYIFQVRWNGQYPLGHRAIFKVEQGALIPVVNEYLFGELWTDQLSWKYPKIHEFLNPTLRSSSFLPLDELNIAKKTKMHRVTEFLTEYDLFQFYTVEDFAKSPSSGLEFEPVIVTDWKASEAGTTPHRIKKRGLLGNDKVNIDTKPRYYSFNGTHSTEIKVTWRFTHTFYNEIYLEEIADGDPLTIPADCQTLIVITKGAYVKQNRSHSYKIQVYRFALPF